MCLVSKCPWCHSVLDVKVSKCLQLNWSTLLHNNFPSCWLQEEFLRARLILSGLREAEWTDIHSQAITDFGTDQTKRILVAFIDPINGLVMQHKIPVVRIDEMMYFIKGPNSPAVTSDNFLNVVQYGKVTGGHIQVDINSYYQYIYL